MLKIKDEVDLSVLEQYGFEYKVGIANSCWEYKTYYTQYIVSEKYRQLDIYGSNECSNYMNVLYDMIVDGIVEKIGE